MKDVLLYGKWLKESVKSKLIFQSYENEYFFTNGYMAFKFNKKNEQYVEMTKRVLFQSLKNDFSISNYELNEGESIKINKLFPVMPKGNDTRLIYENDRKMRIYKNNKNEDIFVDIKYLKNFNHNEYEVFCDKPDKLLLFKNKSLEVDVLVCPVRVSMTNLKISIGE